jgi:chromate transport protein ChrA
MHILSIFPELLTYSLLAPLLLRLTVGILRFGAGVMMWKSNNSTYKWLSIIYFISSLLLIVGLYTQIAVIIALGLVAYDYFESKKAGTLIREKVALAILVTVILISLLFTGPGFLAFDLPL